MTKETPAGEPADLLARAYIDALAQAEGVKHKSMLHRLSEQDPVAEMLADLEGEPSEDGPQLRVDLVAAAVLTARAIAAEPGLAKRLRREAPIVTIATHTADMAPLVTSIIEDCATADHRRKKILGRDGTEKSHTPERNNPDIVLSLNRRDLIVGIAPDPKRHLPSALLRTAEYRLSISALDDKALRLILEAITGMAHTGPIDTDLIRATDISDLSLAFRAGLTPEECLARLAATVQSKTEYLADGPTLEELDGYGAAKTWGLELIADLAEYRTGRLPWDMVDHKGLLLSGPPGTGKTTFAKALAKSAGVPLIATSVAQWNASSYLSGTLQAIRNCFGEARRAAPAILFIDELDGISDRAALRGDYVEYWSQIVNLLLENLQGIEDRPGVVVLGATNYPDRIDPAIRRAGRLDREITLEKPDRETLCKIFRYHLGSDLLLGDDLMPAALAAGEATGADVEAWVRRSKAAARRARRELTLEDLLKQIRSGEPGLSAETRRRVAVHECGHVIVGTMLNAGHLVGVSISDRGGAAEFDKGVSGAMTGDAVERQIAVSLAGRIAEKLILGDVGIGSGNGASSDLAKATRMAELLETHYGLGTFGPVHLGDRPFQDLTRYPGLFEAVRARLDAAEGRAEAILSEHRIVLEALAGELGRRGYLSPDDIEAIIAGQAMPANTGREAAE